MDLLTERWLPVITSTAQRKHISLTELWDDDIRDVDWSRADFQGAAWEFLIGLLHTAVAPGSEDDWQDIWFDGLSAAEWAQALSTVAPAMQFSAQKPSFLQSFEPLDSETSSIAGLLINSPGDMTLKKNTDHFIKRHCTEQICPACAVMALFTLQCWSPAGGAGYRVGLRGGGPLTTLVVPQEDNLPLWKKLWMNVLPVEERPRPEQLAQVFPWLDVTKTSEKKGNIVTSENAHLLQQFWGMPRRIEIDFANTRAGECHVCGEPHPALLLAMRGKNYGVQYDHWVHSLSPYRKGLKDTAAPWLALKGKPGGASYKDWLGLSLESEDQATATQPARVARIAAGRNCLPPVGLWCFAYDMDNAKTRGWYQHRIPLIETPDPKRLSALLYLIIQLATATLLLLKKAYVSAGADSTALDVSWWAETEPAFRALLMPLAADPGCSQAITRQAISQWERNLHHHLFTIFDRDVLSASAQENDALLRQLAARGQLDKSYRTQKLRKQILTQIEEQEEEHA